MKIGLDLDGVVYPWHDSIYRYFQEYKGYSEDIGTFWLKDRHLISEYYVTMPLNYLDQIPSRDILDNVPLIAELGEIYYITARHPDLWWATEKFFDMYQLPFKENIVYAVDKATAIRLHGIDIFLDDFPSNVEAVQSLTDAYLFKCVHNRNDRERFRVVNTMKEFYEIVRSKHDQ